MLPQPIEARMRDARRVLLIGTGGGFDFLCGLPLFFALENRGLEVHLANLSFSPLDALTDARWHDEVLLEADWRSQGADYFPEKWLSHWFRERRAREVSVWCFKATGARPYAQSLAYLAKHLEIDTVIAVDGGVDSLLRGDEHSLGTPLWDALTVAAVDSLRVERKFLVSTAFGAERWDKISHAQALRRIADLTREDALLGVSTLLRASEEGRVFIEAAQHIFERQRRGSIVCSSLLSALRGDFGERPVNSNTEQTPIWVSPLMCLYWFFDLGEVARHKLFLPQLLETQTLTEAAEALRVWSEKQAPAPWESIPI